eukprot:g4561.t1
MRNQKIVGPTWKRLFERQGVHREPETNSTVGKYFVFLLGRRRKVLTSERLLELEASLEHEIRELEEDETRELEEDRKSHLSYQTCVSIFDEVFSNPEIGTSSPVCQPIADLTFGHYISKSRLGRIACEILEKMNRHFSEEQCWKEDIAKKYLSPGIGWEVRDDEQGPDVVSLSRFDNFQGLWRTDHDCSDDNSMMIDIMEMPWIYKKATKLIQYTEVVVLKDAINLYPKVLGFSFPTINYWSREGKLMPRRDLRKGKARITTVPTTFGFRQYIQWGQPYAGFAVAEGQLSFDDNSFQMVNWIQRYDGPHCSLRAVFRRHVK